MDQGRSLTFESGGVQATILSWALLVEKIWGPNRTFTFVRAKIWEARALKCSVIHKKRMKMYVMIIWKYISLAI